MLERFLCHPMLLIWLFLTIKVNLRVAVTVSDTEITVSVEVKSWHMEWVNPLEHNSQHRKYCLEIYLWEVSIKSQSIWPARASSGNGSEAEYYGPQISSQKLRLSLQKESEPLDPPLSLKQKKHIILSADWRTVLLQCGFSSDCNLIPPFSEYESHQSWWRTHTHLM